MADCQDFWAQGLWCPAKALSTLIESYSVFPWVSIFVQVESPVGNHGPPWEHPENTLIFEDMVSLFNVPDSFYGLDWRVAPVEPRWIVSSNRSTIPARHTISFFFFNFYTVILHKYNKYKNNQRTIKHIQSTYTTWYSYDIAWLCAGVCSN